MTVTDGGWLSLVGFQGESFFARVKGGSKLDSLTAVVAVNGRLGVASNGLSPIRLVPIAAE